LLDIGCGALRLGVKAIDFLEQGHYFGSDINPALMQAGYQQELNEQQRAKLPENHLHASEDFDFSFLPAPVDMAVAQSLFTHLPLNHLRHCLAKLAGHIRMGGLFFATAWIVPEDHPIAEPYQQSGELDGEPITTYPIQDSYHYYADDFHYAARQLPWQLQIIGNWNHPRGQQMLCFMRV
jgi:SAM-dependent methyltransferase